MVRNKIQISKKGKGKARDCQKGDYGGNLDGGDGRAMGSAYSTLLEYGSELWGATNWPAAEQIQREVGRLLGMNSKAADEAIRGDLGCGR